MGGVELAIRDLDFEAAARLDLGVQFRLVGNADGTIVSQLASLVNDLHDKVVEQSKPEVVVDIRGLEFMNATCFNVLVAWVNRINDLPPERRYRLQFATNPAIPWQQRSIRTLSCFATDVVEVQG